MPHTNTARLGRGHRYDCHRAIANAACGHRRTAEAATKHERQRRVLTDGRPIQPALVTERAAGKAGHRHHLIVHAENVKGTARQNRHNRTTALGPADGEDGGVEGHGLDGDPHINSPVLCTSAQQWWEQTDRRVTKADTHAKANNSTVTS